MLPLARTEGVLVERLSDEVVVYDVEHDDVHCLNRVAAWVWERCDGATSVDDLAAAAAAALDIPRDPHVVWLALDELASARLLAKLARQAEETPTMTRRDVARKLGLAGAGLALALPIITTVAAPTPLDATSHPVEGGGGCTSSTQCQVPGQGCCFMGVCRPGGGPQCS